MTYQSSPYNQQIHRGRAFETRTEGEHALLSDGRWFANDAQVV